MAQLMQDDVMVKNLTEATDTKVKKEVEITEAIAFAGKSEDTDKLINAIHNIQKTGLDVQGCSFK